jgi:hypothetical protein
MYIYDVYLRDATYAAGFAAGLASSPPTATFALGALGAYFGASSSAFGSASGSRSG